MFPHVSPYDLLSSILTRARAFILQAWHAALVAFSGMSYLTSFTTFIVAIDVMAEPNHLAATPIASAASSRTHRPSSPRSASRAS